MATSEGHDLLQVEAKFLQFPYVQYYTWSLHGLPLGSVFNTRLAPHVSSIIPPDKDDDGNPCTAHITLTALHDTFGLVDYAHAAVQKE